MAVTVFSWLLRGYSGLFVDQIKKLSIQIRKLSLKFVSAVSCSATVTVTDEFELQLTKIGAQARNGMTMFQNWSTKDEIETGIRTFQSIRDKTESTFLKIEWRGDENGRENLYIVKITSRGSHGSSSVVARSCLDYKP